MQERGVGEKGSIKRQKDGGRGGIERKEEYIELTKVVPQRQYC